MTIRATLRIVVFIMATAIAFPLFGIANADAYTPPVTSFEGKANVLPNGVTQIEEVITFITPASLEWTVCFSSIGSLRIEVDGKVLPRRQFGLRKKKDTKMLIVRSTQRGYKWTVSYSTKEAITLMKDNEVLRWQAIAQPGAQIDQANLEITLPFDIKEQQKFSYRPYAFHGVGSSSAIITGARSIRYSSTLLGSQAGFSAIASWPVGGLNISWQKRLMHNLSNVELVFWWIFGMTLPLISVVTLLIMWWKKRHQVHYLPPKEMMEIAPSDLPPMMVAVLAEKKIYAKALTATLINLCQRGYLFIIKDSKDRYVFGKRKTIDDSLRTWEKKLLLEIFATKPVWITDREIERNEVHQLFSPHIIDVYESCYESMTQIGYFMENPHLVRIKYKVFGILLYLTAISGIGWVVFTMQAPVLIIPLLGVLLTSLAIVRLAPIMPMQSEQGLRELGKWTAFRKYLGSRAPLPGSYSVTGVFYEYLPYAIAFGVEDRWIERFRDYRIVMPDWYSTGNPRSMEETEQVVPEILEMVRQLSKLISRLRGPSVT